MTLYQHFVTSKHHRISIQAVYRVPLIKLTKVHGSADKLNIQTSELQKKLIFVVLVCIHIV